MSERIFLLTGSNMGNRLQYLYNAQLQLAELGYSIKHCSAIYESAAWGLDEQPSFYNQCLEVEYECIMPQQLLVHIRQIERQAQRSRLEKWGPRTLDIDILLFGTSVLNSPELSIPHPYLPRRRFALEALNEIAGDFYHPVLLKSITQLLEDCPDQGKVWLTEFPKLASSSV